MFKFQENVCTRQLILQTPKNSGQGQASQNLILHTVYSRLSWTPFGMASTHQDACPFAELIVQNLIVQPRSHHCWKEDLDWPIWTIKLKTLVLLTSELFRAALSLLMKRCS